MGNVKLKETAFRIKRIHEVNERIAKDFSNRYYITYNFSYWYEEDDIVEDERMFSQLYFNDKENPENRYIRNYNYYDFRTNMLWKDTNYYIVNSERGKYFTAV